MVRVEAEETVTTVFGDFSRSGDTFEVSYAETKGDLAGSQTTVTVTDGRRVSVERAGSYPMTLLVEKGVRHEGRYETEYGTMVLGITGTRVEADLHDRGGTLTFTYDIDQGGDLVSQNTLHITVKENF